MRGGSMKEIRPNPPHDGSTTAESEERRGGPLTALLASLGLSRKSRGEGEKGPHEATPDSGAGADLMDQAEAFQTPTLPDAMPPPPALPPAAPPPPSPTLRPA